MKSRYWKLAVVLLSLSIIFSFGWLQSFHSIQKSVFTNASGGNGTAIVAFAVGNVNVNGLIRISSTNYTHSGLPVPVTVMFQNGTRVSVNGSASHLTTPYLNVSFHLRGSVASQSISSAGGPFSINISNAKPLAVGFMGNISESYFLHTLPSQLRQYGPGVNYYLIYVSSYAFVNVKLTGGAL